MGKILGVPSFEGGKFRGSILQVIMLSYLLDFKWKYQPSSEIYNSGVQQSIES